jgi:hypothetical protein
MKSTTTFNNLGGLQSLMFCVGIYVVALFFSIFVCSAVFYAIYPRKDITSEITANAKANHEKQALVALQ